MANSSDVLRAIDKLGNKIDNLNEKLYGKNGFEGDIPEIKNGVNENDKRISRNSRIIFTIVGILSASGLGAGIVQLLG